MRYLSFALAAALSTTAFAAELVTTSRLHNSAMGFVEFWDANKDKPAAEQVAEFKARVAPVFPGFYSAERLKDQFTPAQYDGLIADSIKEFPTLRAQYVKKAQQFESDLPKYIETFKVVFPDFQPPADIYVLHSLGEMDGGTRPVDGKIKFIFGVDAMAKFHGPGSESAFFHHELFHFYHGPLLGQCGDGPVWAALWNEGLAVYVSKALNPDASEEELLLEVPNKMAERTRAVLPQALAQLEGVLDKTDFPSYAGVFLRRGNAGDLPPRRGYYLGYLVAQEAAKTHDVRVLAKLNCSQVKEIVYSGMRALRAKYPVTKAAGS
jgi:hypothetical protein